eukprot:TRINITY_DN1775_c0_g1_i4.p1 TRINITY_DN1775_c0_g1~~TRINITY_DN1775_c0_g1_i4.p1  ORF type:complete len:2361 (+),score=516.35 TRINITY_DN1775_c0_g1_i4:87-7169(+)
MAGKSGALPNGLNSNGDTQHAANNHGTSTSNAGGNIQQTPATVYPTPSSSRDTGGLPNSKVSAKTQERLRSFLKDKNPTSKRYKSLTKLMRGEWADMMEEKQFYEKHHAAALSVLHTRFSEYEEDKKSKSTTSGLASIIPGRSQSLEISQFFENLRKLLLATRPITKTQLQLYHIATMVTRGLHRNNKHNIRVAAFEVLLNLLLDMHEAGVPSFPKSNAENDTKSTPIPSGPSPDGGGVAGDPSGGGAHLSATQMDNFRDFFELAVDMFNNAIDLKPLVKDGSDLVVVGTPPTPIDQGPALRPSTESPTVDQAIELLERFLGFMSAGDENFSFWYQLLRNHYLALFYPEAAQHFSSTPNTLSKASQSSNSIRFQVCPYEVQRVLIDRLELWTASTQMCAVLFSQEDGLLMLEIFKQSCSLPLRYTATIRKAINVFKSCFMTLPKMKTCLGTRRQQFWRRFIQSLAYVFSNPTGAGVEDVDNYAMLCKEILNIYMQLHSECGERMDSATWSHLLETVSCCAHDLVKRMDYIHQGSSPAIQSLANLLFQRLYYLWITAPVPTPEMWAKLRSSLAQLTHWRAAVVQWRYKMLQLTETLIIFKYELNDPLTDSSATTSPPSSADPSPSTPTPFSQLAAKENSLLSTSGLPQGSLEAPSPPLSPSPLSFKTLRQQNSSTNKGTTAASALVKDQSKFLLEVEWNEDKIFRTWSLFINILGNINQIVVPENYKIAMECVRDSVQMLLRARLTQPYNEVSRVPINDTFLPWLIEATCDERRHTTAGGLNTTGGAGGHHGAGDGASAANGAYATEAIAGVSSYPSGRPTPTDSPEDGLLLAYEVLCSLFCTTSMFQPPLQLLAYFYTALNVALTAAIPRVCHSVLVHSMNLFSFGLPGSCVLIPSFLDHIKGTFMSNAPIPEDVELASITIVNSLLSATMQLPHDGLPDILEAHSDKGIFTVREMRDQVSSTLIAILKRPRVFPATRITALWGASVLLFEELSLTTSQPISASSHGGPLMSPAPAVRMDVVRDLVSILLEFCHDPEPQVSFHAVEAVSSVASLFDSMYDVAAGIIPSIITGLCDSAAILIGEAADRYERTIVAHYWALVEWLVPLTAQGNNVQWLANKHIMEKVFGIIELGIMGSSNSEVASSGLFPERPPPLHLATALHPTAASGLSASAPVMTPPHSSSSGGLPPPSPSPASSLSQSSSGTPAASPHQHTGNLALGLNTPPSGGGGKSSTSKGLMSWTSPFASKLKGARDTMRDTFRDNTRGHRDRDTPSLPATSGQVRPPPPPLPTLGTNISPYTTSDALSASSSLSSTSTPGSYTSPTSSSSSHASHSGAGGSSSNNKVRDGSDPPNPSSLDQLERIKDAAAALLQYAFRHYQNFTPVGSDRFSAYIPPANAIDTEGLFFFYNNEAIWSLRDITDESGKPCGCRMTVRDAGGSSLWEFRMAEDDWVVNEAMTAEGNLDNTAVNASIIRMLSEASMKVLKSSGSLGAIQTKTTDSPTDDTPAPRNRASTTAGVPSSSTQTRTSPSNDSHHYSRVKPPLPHPTLDIMDASAHPLGQYMTFPGLSDTSISATDSHIIETLQSLEIQAMAEDKLCRKMEEAARTRSELISSGDPIIPPHSPSMTAAADGEALGTAPGVATVSLSAYHYSRLLLTHLGLLSEVNRARMILVDGSKNLYRSLAELDKMQERETHKIGVVYVAPGQESQKDILANDFGTIPYQVMVNGIGTAVSVASHRGFMGGLDAGASCGRTSPYFNNSTQEVMYHVVTSMPTNSADPAQVLKKRHVGNDNVHIVYSDHPRPYRHDTIKGQFNDAHIIIYPLPDHLFRVQIYKKQQVERFGPLQDGMVVSMSILPALVRATAINADRAARTAQAGGRSYASSKPFAKRRELIKEIVLKHKNDKSFGDFFLPLFLPSGSSVETTHTSPRTHTPAPGIVPAATPTPTPTPIPTPSSTPSDTPTLLSPIPQATTTATVADPPAAPSHSTSIGETPSPALNSTTTTTSATNSAPSSPSLARPDDDKLSLLSLAGHAVTTTLSAGALLNVDGESGRLPSSSGRRSWTDHQSTSTVSSEGEEEDTRGLITREPRDRDHRDRDKDRDRDRDREGRSHRHHHHRDKGGERDHHRERDRDRGERDRDRAKSRERRHRDPERDRERDRDREKEREKDKDRGDREHRDRDRERDRDKDRGERDRDRDRERDRDRDRERERGDHHHREHRGKSRTRISESSSRSSRDGRDRGERLSATPSESDLEYASTPYASPPSSPASASFRGYPIASSSSGATSERISRPSSTESVHSLGGGGLNSNGEDTAASLSTTTTPTITTPSLSLLKKENSQTDVHRRHGRNSGGSSTGSSSRG